MILGVTRGNIYRWETVEIAGGGAAAFTAPWNKLVL